MENGNAAPALPIRAHPSKDPSVASFTLSRRISDVEAPMSFTYTYLHLWATIRGKEHSDSTPKNQPTQIENPERLHEI